MRKTFFLCAFVSAQILFSQVSLEKGKLIKDGQRYKLSQYDQVFQNAEARAHFKKARANETAGSIFAGIGGGMIGYGIARALSGGSTTVTVGGQSQTVKPDNSAAWTVAGIGLGVVGIGIPFALAAKKNADKALALENGTDSTAFQPYFRLKSAGNGVAFSYNF